MDAYICKIYLLLIILDCTTCFKVTKTTLLPLSSWLKKTVYPHHALSSLETTPRRNTLMDDADDLQRQLDNEARERYQHPKPKTLWLFHLPGKKSSQNLMSQHAIPFIIVQAGHNLYKRQESSREILLGTPPFSKQLVSYKHPTTARRPTTTRDTKETEEEGAAPKGDSYSPSWSYAGISEWYKQYPACAGRLQSPIMIPTGALGALIPVRSLRPLLFKNYDKIPFEMTLKNDGNRLLLFAKWPHECWPSIWGGAIQSRRYLFHSVELHWPSEHFVNYEQFPLELQVIHYAAEFNNFETALESNDPEALLILAYLYVFSEETKPRGVAILLETAAKEAETMSKTDISSTNIDTVAPKTDTDATMPSSDDDYKYMSSTPATTKMVQESSTTSTTTASTTASTTTATTTTRRPTTKLDKITTNVDNRNLFHIRKNTTKHKDILFKHTTTGKTAQKTTKQKTKKIKPATTAATTPATSPATTAATTAATTPTTKETKPPTDTTSRDYNDDLFMDLSPSAANTNSSKGKTEDGEELESMFVEVNSASTNNNAETMHLSSNFDTTTVYVRPRNRNKKKKKKKNKFKIIKRRITGKKVMRTSNMSRSKTLVFKKTQDLGTRTMPFDIDRTVWSSPLSTQQSPSIDQKQTSLRTSFKDAVKKIFTKKPIDTTTCEATPRDDTDSVNSDEQSDQEKYNEAEKILDPTYLPPAMALNDIFPTFSKAYATYSGSLTTPPCKEAVRWIVYARPLLITRDLLESARSLASVEGLMKMNFRPPQPLNDRPLFYYY